MPGGCFQKITKLARMAALKAGMPFEPPAFTIQRLLGLNREIVNVNGTGVGLGHPVGATGCRIVVSLIYEMKRRGLKLRRRHGYVHPGRKLLSYGEEEER